MIKNNEDIYDKKINPLMKQIQKIAQENNIPFHAEFQISDDLMCTSCNKEPEGYHIIFNIFSAVTLCCMGEQFNIDKFLFWFLKKFDVSQSIFLREYNKNKDNIEC